MGPRGRPHEDLPEDELVRCFTQSGDKDSFAELFVRHARKVYLACYAFFGDAGLAEDATSETFLRAYQNKERFQEGNYLGWLHRIARNVCIDLWRKKCPQISIDSCDRNLALPLASSLPDEGTRVAVLQMRREIKKLPPDQRKCVELKMEGYSYEETASITGLTIDAVRSHIQNGRRTLRVRMRGTTSNELA